MKKLARLSFKLVWWQLILTLPLVLVRVALGQAGLTRTRTDANEIRIASMGDGLVYKSEARAFRGGAICWIASGLVLDLRGASLADEGADLTIVTVMAGTEVVVPPEWPVELSGRVIMGGADAPREAGIGGPSLRIKGLTLMAGLNVSRRSVPDGDGPGYSAAAGL